MSPILLLLFVLLAYYIYKFYSNARRFPKGPFPLPLIGNLHQFGFEACRMHIFFEQCARKYGPIFTVFTPKPLVILMDYEQIKEAFVTKGDDFAGRSGEYPDTLFMHIPNGGVIFSDGDNWKEQRRTSISILRDFGMGKNLMEQQVTSSIEDFLQHLQTLDLSRVDFRWPIQILVANVINDVLFGYRYKYDDCGRLMHFSDLLAWEIESIRRNPLVLLANHFPFIENVPFIGWHAVGKYKAHTAKMRDLVMEDVERCKAATHAEAEPDCFVTAYLQKADKSEYLDEEQLLNVCFDFFMAGMETTSTTLRWAMLHLAANQDVQALLRAEIHSVLGRHDLPRMADRARLPLTAAAVAEVQRVSNIIPINVPHRTVCDTQVGGQLIPKDTIVVGQVYNVLQHSSVFENPRQFRPERFLEADGKAPNKNALEHFVPFSLGRRQCAGEGLARMELFLALTAILQRYGIEAAEGTTVDLSPIVGMVNTPRPTELKLTPFV